MRATLEYSYEDKNIFWRSLTSKDVKVISSKSCDYGDLERVSIEIESYEELNKLVNELNQNTTYGVSIIKTSGILASGNGRAAINLLRNLFR